MLVPLPPHCIVGKFIRRVKRFSIEFEYGGGTHWAHCNHSGAMIGLLNPGCDALFSLAPRTGRKLLWTIERIRLPERAGGFWVGVDTMMSNKILAAAHMRKLLPFCAPYGRLQQEVRRGQSRLDALFTEPGLPPLWVECKNVALVEDCRAAFPASPSVRAQKHIRELMEIVACGERAAMFYLIQRPDGRCFGPADYVDARYAELFAEAVAAGVEIYAHRAVFSGEGTGLGVALPLKI